ncbi:MAG: hypothetical protein GF370_00140 [Candidatus Nealsonbacteria bacterium]|nr:hypothetical protein [Candidatus Nealsonbacteria bacterium]
MRKLKTLEIILIGFFLLIVVFGIWRVFLDQPEEEKEKTVKEQIFSIIAGFDFSDPQSFTTVSEIDSLGEQSVPVLQELLNSNSLSDRWAAIILLPRFAKNNEDLRPGVIEGLQKTVDDENDTLRMLTGAQLLSLGEKQGIPVLISCLDSTAATHFGEPPELVKDRSLFYLRHYAPFQGKTVQEWQAWWETNQERIAWNEEKEVFEIQ